MTRHSNFEDRWRMPTNLRTRHAAKREQQRAIPPLFTELVLDYAQPRKRSRGDNAFSYSLDRRAWKRVVADYGPEAQRYERARDIYVIESGDGTIITVAWRH